MSIIYYLIGFTGFYAVIAQMAGWTWGPHLLFKILEVLVMVPFQIMFELVFAILEGLFSAFD